MDHEENFSKKYEIFECLNNESQKEEVKNYKIKKLILDQIYQ